MLLPVTIELEILAVAPKLLTRPLRLLARMHFSTFSSAGSNEPLVSAPVLLPADTLLRMLTLLPVTTTAEPLFSNRELSVVPARDMLGGWTRTAVSTMF